MNNYIFLSPNTVQFTYEKHDLQGKEICFSNSTSSSSSLILPSISFSEKHISGFINILGLIADSNIIYFTLPINFDECSTIQFVYDLLAACRYNKPDYIVFDRSRCASAEFYCLEKLTLCNYIQQLFEESGLPVIHFNSINDKTSSKNSKASNIKFHNLGDIEISLMKLKNISKQIQKVFDVKDSLIENQYSRNIQNKCVSEKVNKSKYSYTLN